MKTILKQRVTWLDSDVETVIGLFLGRLGAGDGLLLESAEVDGRWGRYSLAAGDYLLTAVCRDGRLALTVSDDRLKDLERLSGRPFFDGLAELAGALEIESDSNPAAPPITRALYGDLGYGAAAGARASAGGEEGFFVLPGTVYLFDHPYHQLVRLSLRPEAEGSGPVPARAGETRLGPPLPSWDRAGYLKAAAEAAGLIRLGRAREITLATQFAADFTGDLFPAYRRLRRGRPSAYMVFMRFGDFSLAVSSPEAMITCEQGKLFLSPLAGSRSLNRTLDEDNLFEDELLSDPRELARHLALVGQGREELALVAKPGSVQVERLMEMERFENLRRLTSRLSATAAEGRSAVDILRAVFPAGAVSGTPKAEARRLIDGLEPAARGPYGGAVGWLGLDRGWVNLDFGITTQALWTRGGRAFWAVGVGLTEGSDPDRGWREIMARAETARALLAPEAGPAAGPPPEGLTPRGGAAVPLPAAAPAPPEAAPRLPVLMENLAEHQDLTRDTAAYLFARLMDGELSSAQAGALLMGLKSKGETALELAEAARAILARAVPLPPLPGPFIDIVGTGGDGRYSFNCSTATALTLAGLGYKVVKHGNRSVSSKSGSADALELLGENLNRPPELVPEALARRNFVFLFAPAYHPSFKHIMPVRKELGI
ncbi:MAG: chorismate-binding protein, partial [Candidatus Adiutrix sp.]|nr:chorismate-binding protein [Candidatus Adiutrix sp.]